MARSRKNKAAVINKKTVMIIGLFVILAAVIGFINIRNSTPAGSDIRLTDEGYTHAARFGSCIVANGIDVSSHQGDDINWDMVKSSGADFVFIRAGVRTSDEGTLEKDRCFDRNIKKARKADLLVGVYFFSQATSAEEAAEEAAFVLDTVSGYDIDLPVAFDYEIYQGGRLSSAASAGALYAASQYNDIAMTFCRKIEDAGYESAIYANYDMFTHYMDASLLEGHTRLWLAQYSPSTDFATGYRFWQCSDSAEVGGIDGSVDHDFWYIIPEEVYQTPAPDDAVSIGECTIEFEKESYGISKRRARPEVTVSCGGSALKEGTDYTATPILNIDKGTGYVIVRGIGGYKDWKAVPFTID